MRLFNDACMAKTYKIARITFPLSLIIHAIILACDPATDRRDVMRLTTYCMVCMLLFMAPPAARNVGAAARDAQGQLIRGEEGDNPHRPPARPHHA